MDTRGWYKKGLILGVVFVELGHEIAATVPRISEKVGRALAKALRADQLQKLKISLHLYPEQQDGERNGTGLFDLYLYPDLSKKNRTNRMSLVLKRIMDFLGSACALTLLSPLFGVIALAVKMSSPGPVFYKQVRIGLSGNRFTLYKFRSMYVNSDPSDHIDYIKRYIGGGRDNTSIDRAVDDDGVYKLTNDPRVTRFGRLLRKTSLDELPQFFNVLKGDMALVGPRPPIPYECENYEVWHRRRVLEVKPGLTGLWQVKGRSTTTFDDMVRLDLRYAKEWSLWLDLRILFETPATVLNGKGAY
jgi:exopolysaccharide biosynthesis polyprenyl glycosylphosphotransferase